MEKTRPNFRAGKNIAMKVPTHEFERTVSFYRDILGLPCLGESEDSATPNVRFDFGGKTLWIDCVPSVSQAEIWLEVITDDAAEASQLLDEAGCSRRDEIEPLPEGIKAFWIANPANIIHLVSEAE